VSLSLVNIAKKYNRDWVFRNTNFQFEIPGSYVIKGSNGSGKSTLLKILSGFLTPTEGELKLLIKSNNITTENWSNHIAYAAPYYELIEEMYLEEFVSFYIKFKPLQKGISQHDLIKIAYLEEAKNKQIKNFSSGMRQRLKLALAWLSDVSIVLLDEPCSNLDARGIEWYKNLANKYSENRLVIVCSNNIEDEFSFCKKSLDMDNFIQIPSS
jgi:ABC-type multidrug transport system ATPase subunit